VKLPSRLDVILGKKVVKNQLITSLSHRLDAHLGKAGSEQSINNILKLPHRLDAILGKQVENNQEITALNSPAGVQYSKKNLGVCTVKRPLV
jgi:hypothetical protein